MLRKWLRVQYLSQLTPCAGSPYLVEDAGAKTFPLYLHLMMKVALQPFPLAQSTMLLLLLARPLLVPFVVLCGARPAPFASPDDLVEYLGQVLLLCEVRALMLAMHLKAANLLSVVARLMVLYRVLQA